MAQADDQQDRLTLWIGGLHQNVTEDILYELFQNAGPLQGVKIPVDGATRRPKNFAFIKFHHEESLPYAVQIFRDVTLFGQNLRFPRNMQPTVSYGNQRHPYTPSPHQHQHDNRMNESSRRNNDSGYQRYTPSGHNQYYHADQRHGYSPEGVANPWNSYDQSRGQTEYDYQNRYGREDQRRASSRHTSGRDYNSRDQSPDNRSRSFHRNPRQHDDRNQRHRDNSYEPRRR